ncbi:NAD(+)/NADH kinase [Chloroflexota bacterium]
MKSESVGILYHPLKEEAYTLAKKLEELLISQSLSVWLRSSWEWEKARPRPDGKDLILSVGGDGTILRAAQVAIHSSTPIIGINVGRLGFMTELTVDEVLGKLPALLEGEGWIDERSLLEAEVSLGDGQTPSLFWALNDVVVARGAVARLINIEAIIDGELLTIYRADGVIVATATGSTGYALAAGGPIMHPQTKDFLLQPILSHLSSYYSLVLPQASVVQLNLSTTQSATMSIDGHISLPLQSGANITVRHSLNTVRFLRIRSENSFYSSLEQRLKGKQ